MIAEIVKARRLFYNMLRPIEDFMSEQTKHNEDEILAFSFPKYIKQIQTVEYSWRKCFDYALEVIKVKPHFIDFFKSEYKCFQDHVLENYYNGYIKTFVLGRPHFVTTETLNKNADLKRTLLEEFAKYGFEEYKVVLFDLLYLFEEEINNYNKIVSASLPNYNKDSSILLNFKSDSVEKAKEIQLSEIFIEPDWEKYFKILEKVTPPILENFYCLTPEKKGIKGVIQYWIFKLQLKGKVFGYYNEPDLAGVLNRNLQNISFGALGSNFHKDSTLYLNHYENQLKDLAKDFNIDLEVFES